MKRLFLIVLVLSFVFSCGEQKPEWIKKDYKNLVPIFSEVEFFKRETNTYLNIFSTDDTTSILFNEKGDLINFQCDQECETKIRRKFSLFNNDKLRDVLIDFNTFCSERKIMASTNAFKKEGITIMLYLENDQRALLIPDINQFKYQEKFKDKIISMGEDWYYIEKW